MLGCAKSRPQLKVVDSEAIRPHCPEGLSIESDSLVKNWKPNSLALLEATLLNEFPAERMVSAKFLDVLLDAPEKIPTHWPGIGKPIRLIVFAGTIYVRQDGSPTAFIDRYARCLYFGHQTLESGKVVHRWYSGLVTLNRKPTFPGNWWFVCQ